MNGTKWRWEKGYETNVDEEKMIQDEMDKDDMRQNGDGMKWRWGKVDIG